MKKIGFTLAEVLITLSIIGVVAALTAPALTTSVQKSKVGPSIRRFMTTVETANEHLLQDNETDVLSSIFRNGDKMDDMAYLKEFNNYARGRIDTRTLDKYTIVPKNINGGSENAPDPQDYTYYVFTFESGDDMGVHLYPTENLKGGTYKGNMGRIYYDMNGFDTKPNRLGKDIFLFRLDDSGAVYPDGGRTQKALEPNRSTNNLWWGSGWGSCNETKVSYGLFCGASVVDNNYKVIYKY